MTQVALILGASGRFGRSAAEAFARAGWQVRRFQRGTQDLAEAASGAQVIVSCWNPAYPDWAAQVPELHRQVIAVAEASGATVIVPGNVYVFGPQTPSPWCENSSHAAQNPLGRIRIEMEKAYRASSAQVIVLRAGDYLDTEASGNWFDTMITAKLHKGKFSYPGRADIAHAWAYLPDVARAAVGLAEIRANLPRHLDVPFAGYTLSGQEMLSAINRHLRHPARLRQMSWLPLQLARPFWPLGRCLLEMRYLWNTPHSLSGGLLQQLLPDFRDTPLRQALPRCLPGGLLSDQGSTAVCKDLVV
ncbi:sugar nucleotide-binding protein [Pseudophaeobacter profundi]|uniref:sugar nucleotide-binding protein n=1 Tax=Pseudophaeobacter profundi TaxID=3034152 RepID=UPI00242D9FA5|nr:sugar nucleotide-binding protein [Pseudophaeobacter profundi]